MTAFAYSPINTVPQSSTLALIPPVYSWCRRRTNGLDPDDLIVAEAYLGKNLVMKRFHARGRGRSGAIMKPFSQITVVVREVTAAADKEA